MRTKGEKKLTMGRGGKGKRRDLVPRREGVKCKALGRKD